MQKAKYTAEFKEEAVRQVIERGQSVIDTEKHLKSICQTTNLVGIIWQQRSRNPSI